MKSNTKKGLTVLFTVLLLVGLLPTAAMAGPAPERGVGGDKTTEVRYSVNGPDSNVKMGDTIEIQVVASNPGSVPVKRSFYVSRTNMNSENTQLYSGTKGTFKNEETVRNNKAYTKKDVRIPATGEVGFTIEIPVTTENKFERGEIYSFQFSEGFDHPVEFDPHQSPSYITTVLNADTTSANEDILVGGQILESSGFGSLNEIAYAQSYRDSGSAKNGLFYDDAIPTNPDKKIQGTISQFYKVRGPAKFSENERGAMIKPDNDGDVRVVTRHHSLPSGERQTLVITYNSDHLTKDDVLNIEIIDSQGKVISGLDSDRVISGNASNYQTVTYDLNPDEVDHVNSQGEVFIRYVGDNINTNSKFEILCQAIVTEGNAPVNACTGQQQIEDGIFLSYGVDRTAILSGDVVSLTPTIQNTNDVEKTVEVKLKQERPTQEEPEVLAIREVTVPAESTIELDPLYVSMVEPGIHGVTINELDQTSIRVSGAQGVPNYDVSFNAPAEATTGIPAKIDATVSETTGNDLNDRDVKKVIYHKFEMPPDDKPYVINQEIVTVGSGQTITNTYEAPTPVVGEYQVQVNNQPTQTMMVSRPKGPVITDHTFEMKNTRVQGTVKLNAPVPNTYDVQLIVRDATTETKIIDKTDNVKINGETKHKYNEQLFCSNGQKYDYTIKTYDTSGGVEDEVTGTLKCKSNFGGNGPNWGYL